MSKSDFLSPVQSHGPFSVPKLGEVYIREVAFSKAVNAYQGAAGGERTSDQSMAAIVVATVFDGEGNQVFSPSDIDAIAEMPMARMKPLIDLVMKHSGIDAEELESVEGN